MEKLWSGKCGENRGDLPFGKVILPGVCKCMYNEGMRSDSLPNERG
jgi:hypothetical protein